MRNRSHQTSKLLSVQDANYGPHDCGGPLDGWSLSFEDLTLFAARHRAIQAGEHQQANAPMRKLLLGGK
jgi:hypothetical protein